jgi:hypothetical protein
MAMGRRMFGREFTEGAIRSVRETRRPIAQVAGELGLNESTLRRRVNLDASIGISAAVSCRALGFRRPGFPSGATFELLSRQDFFARQEADIDSFMESPAQGPPGGSTHLWGNNPPPPRQCGGDNADVSRPIA